MISVILNISAASVLFLKYINAVYTLGNLLDVNVKIFNRAGIKIYEADGYNNDDVIFNGIGLNGIYLSSQELPDGTYFYVIDKGDGSRPVTGYLELIR